MTLNKTKIEWCDRTWNPVTGCLHGCSYCYARKIAERFKGSKAWPQGFTPTFRPERLGDPSKETKPQTIFVCSMADLFGEWVPDKWIEEILFQCSEYPRHTYCFLTKNPIRYITTVEGKFDHLLRDSMWFGTTVTGNKDVDRISYLQAFDHENVFVSFEPLLEKIKKIDLTYIKGVILGARTKPSSEITPEMFLPIQDAAYVAGNVPVFCKDSMPSWTRCWRELPWQVQK